MFVQNQMINSCNNFFMSDTSPIKSLAIKDQKFIRCNHCKIYCTAKRRTKIYLVCCDLAFVIINNENAEIVGWFCLYRS